VFVRSEKVRILKRDEVAARRGLIPLNDVRITPRGKFARVGRIFRVSMMPVPDPTDACHFTVALLRMTQQISVRILSLPYYPQTGQC
jgi:hypothetical protein